MDLREFRYFLAVVEEKNITAAAQKLHISQPPLSRTIKSLEEKIGTPLFIRGLSGLELTDAGKELAIRAKELLLLHSEITRDMKEICSQIHNRIVFGVNDGSKIFVLPHYIRMVKQNFENAEIIVEHLPTTKILNGVLEGNIDIGFLRTPFSNRSQYEIQEVSKESWVALLSKDYHLSHELGDNLTFKELEAHPLILPSRQSLYLPILEEFSVDKKPPNVICYYFELENAVTLAGHNLGIAIVPNIIQNMINEDYLVKTIIDLQLTTGYCAIMKKDNFPSEFSKQLWSMIRRSGLIIS